jgi:sec-independent protein translocase protein TatC
MKYWKYAVLVIFLLAGLATPPDIFSQLVLGLPLIVLYFLGVYLAKRVEQEKLKNEA